jgi:hypothetical protein
MLSKIQTALFIQPQYWPALMITSLLLYRPLLVINHCLQPVNLGLCHCELLVESTTLVRRFGIMETK